MDSKKDISTEMGIPYSVIKSNKIEGLNEKI